MKTRISLVVGIILVMFVGVSSVYAGGVNDMTSPLQGRWDFRTVTHEFDDVWAGTPSSCTNYTWKHAGTDVQAWAPEAVYAAEAGVVKAVNTNALYGGWVTIEHTPPGESTFTTVYWHIIPSVSLNQSVFEGQWIGNVADLDDDTHFHFGVRMGSYSNTSNRGALPEVGCWPYPAFFENFIDPLSKSYHSK